MYRVFKRPAKLAALSMTFYALAFADELKVAANAADLEPQAASTPQKTGTAKPVPPSPDPDDLHVSIYPIFGWLPSFTSNFSVPPGTGGGPVLDGSTDSNISGVLAIAADVTYKKWLFEAEGLKANVSGTRNTPNASLSAHVKYADLFVGRKFGENFYVIAGARYIGLKFRASVLNSPTFEVSRGVWDPMVGLEYRKALGHKLNLKGRFDIGGFGAGSQVDTSGQLVLEWKFAKHFGTVLGYQILYDKLEGTVSRQVANVPINYNWQYAQTFHGPILGFGIYF